MDSRYVCENKGHKVTFHTKKTSLRSEVYRHLTDYIELNPNTNNVGRTVIFVQWISNKYVSELLNILDAMSIVQHFGKPSLFITMACNPNRLEIVTNSGVGESADIVLRVFKYKLAREYNKYNEVPLHYG